MTILMNRKETCEYIANRITMGLSTSANRYGDGEYMLANKQPFYQSTKENIGEISDLLISALQNRQVLHCIPELKPHNIEKKDRWYDAQDFFIRTGGHDVYGASNWNIYDFQNDLIVLPRLFIGKTLYVTSYPEEVMTFFADIADTLQVFEVPRIKASLDQNEISIGLESLLKSNYRNIIISCGPLAKWLVSYLTRCVALNSWFQEPVNSINIIDLGSLTNAFIGKENEWTMSWTNTVDLAPLRKRLLEKIIVLRNV